MSRKLRFRNNRANEGTTVKGQGNPIKVYGKRWAVTIVGTCSLSIVLGDHEHPREQRHEQEGSDTSALSQHKSQPETSSRITGV